MKIIKNSIIPFPGFAAINLFGFLFTRSSNLSEKTINHESIHTEQMKETLYIFFYIWYGTEYVIRLAQVLYKKDYTAHQAYKDISFEQEAYKYDDDLEYIKNRKRYSWLKFL